MVIQYPYTLQKLSIADSSQDSNGYFNVLSETWIDVCKCRDADAKQKKVYKDDGSYLVASFLVQCPKGVEALKASDQIKVVDQQGNIRVEGSVLSSSKKQLHTQVWV